MKYENIIKYKKVMRNIEITLRIIIYLIMSTLLALLFKSTKVFILVIIIGACTTISKYIKLETEIKEMEINAQYDNTNEKDSKAKLKDGKIDLDNWD